MRKKQETPPQIAAYDKIIKENLTALLPRLLQIFNLDIAQGIDIKENLQRTKERRPDLLQKVTDKKGATYILHVEFQVGGRKTKNGFSYVRLLYHADGRI